MCRGKTTSGKKCKRKTEPFCYQHLPPSLKPELPLTTKDCTASVIKKIEKRVAKPPSASDGEGYIYAYTLDSDPPHFYKIGRTARTPEKRVKEWGKGAKLKAWWKVKNQKKTERLIHLYLDHVRVYRYQLDNGNICSVWKDDGEAVTDKDEKLKKKHKLTARTKQIEWFRMPWKNIKKVLEKLCE